jgi:hypothetical protein
MTSKKALQREQQFFTSKYKTILLTEKELMSFIKREGYGE